VVEFVGLGTRLIESYLAKLWTFLQLVLLLWLV
jgi:hypothetical protein